ncbi:MAG: penicillin acylase family protein [Proteobacteria bacterium]|nr:penicillin acylase family protein [Pseudomonadota bacterium]
MTLRGKVRAWLLRTALVLVSLIMIALGGGYVALRTSLPQTDGTVRLAGLRAGVEVVREANGVPHIFAQSIEDAYFALGFVHAQDRLWQMEARRRLGAGRLSEILGQAAIGSDRFQRTLGLYRAAERGWDALDEETRAAYLAYAAGVNAFLDTRRGVLPPEFLILRAPAPAPWRPADSLVVLKLMSLDLSRNWRDELLRGRLAARLDRAQIEALWPSYPADGPVALPGFKALGALLGPLPLAALSALTPPAEAPGVGSNNELRL